MNGKFGRILAVAAVTATAGTALITGTAFASDDGDSCCHKKSHTIKKDSHDRDYSRDDSHDREGGEGGKGGSNSAKCLVPVGLSAGAVASSGGEVDQCNARGGNGGEGGAGDVDF